VSNLVPICKDLTTGQKRPLTASDALANSDGSSAIPYVPVPFGGDGSLGAITFSSNQAVSPGVYNYTSVTINNAITITVGLPSTFNDGVTTFQFPGALHFKTTGSFTNNGTLSANGAGWPGGSATTPPYGLGGAGGGGAGDSNGAVGGGVSVRLGGTTTVFGGGQSSIGQPGGPGISTSQTAEGLLGYPVAVPRAGAGGAESGGGSVGGAGGGIIVIECKGNLTEGTIVANGSSGANGVGVGGGGGGGGGTIFELYMGTLTTGIASASGGSGGTGSFNGGNGGAGRVYRQKVGV
jgi:hypothetical protein